MMITTIILMFTALIVLFAIYITNRTAEKPSRNILFGTTLPFDALKHKDVVIIMKNYHRAYTTLSLIFLALLIPMIFTYRYISICFFYLTFWICLYFLINEIISSKYYGELRSLKQQNNWWVGERHIINIDTEVSRLKNLFPVSKRWFVLPILISVIPIAKLLIIRSTEISTWIIGFSSMFVTSLCFFIYHITVKAKTVVYSESTEINLSLNKVYKRQLSLCWVIIACIESILSVTAFLTFTISDKNYLLFAIVICSSAVALVPIIYSNYKVREERTRLLQLENGTVYTDDDEFWLRDYYNNPNDCRMWVEKRIGYGMAVNIGIPSGKAWRIASRIVLTLSAVLLIGLGIYIMPLDFGKTEISISNEIISITVPYLTYEVRTENIISVKLIDNFPSATKKHGRNSETAYHGEFNIKGYGLCKVYVNPKSPPFIVIELINGWLFLNGETKEQTEAYYEALNTYSMAYMMQKSAIIGYLPDWILSSRAFFISIFGQAPRTSADRVAVNAPQNG